MHMQVTGMNDGWFKTVRTSLLGALLTVGVPVLSRPGSGPSSSSCPLGPGWESHEVVNESTTKLWPYQKYHSSPFNPPEFAITRNGKPLAPGYIFITPENFSPVPGAKDLSPLIVTDAGQLVWNAPVANTTNFRVASLHGKDVLTYWSGDSPQGANVGHGYGNVTILDSSYRPITVVCPKLGLVTPDNVKYQCDADLHESFITDRGTLIVSAYNATTADLSLLGGPKNGFVFDCLFFELDLSGKILFRWSALEHVPVSQTKYPLKGTGQNQSAPFDYFHVNSIVNVGAGYYLVNSRHCWATYLVDLQGKVVWTLQGDDGGDFGALPTNGKFSWQHFARPAPESATYDPSAASFNITYFNNLAAYPLITSKKPSTGLFLSLPLPPSKAKPPTVISALTDPQEPISAGSQGSRSTLPNGNVFMGYGEISVLKEYGPANFPDGGGDVRWSARFGADNLVQSYRGYKHPWKGRPTTSPSLVVVKGKSGCNTGYVSWNGATEVAAWLVSAGESKTQLEPVGQVAYRGFETSFHAAGACVQVEAVDAYGCKGTKSSIVCI